MTSQIISIRQDQVLYVWPIFAEYLETTWPEHLDRVLSQALKSHYQLWLVTSNLADIHGVFITSVRLGEGRVLELKYLTGSFNRADFKAIHLAVLTMQKHTNAVRVEGVPDFKAPRYLKSLGCQTDVNSTCSN